ncbi:histone deacetylase [Sessilibacter corallicola]|uniref:Histone deacetylase n=2 Tax=Sessilibacter corallicola TaxID=2904075 RepID=A0ABQ0A930_9GAMM
MIPLITHPLYSYNFDSKHRFPMEKFGLISAYLREKNILTRENCYRPGRAKDSVLALAHCEDYLHRFIHNQQSAKEIRRMGLPWSEGLVTRTLLSPNGTLLAASLALRHGIACHLAGGTHHAHRDFASGFCILNDLAVASLALIHLGKVKRILIFDCDVHQGDGTASILENEDRIVTCSIHCEKNFPVNKAQSNVDIGLEKGMKDDAYLDVVTNTLTKLLDDVEPCLVFYDAGVDIYEHDPLGLLSISEPGIRERDRQVLSICQNRKIPVITVIGGGYDNDRKALARRHSMVTEEAHKLFA